VLRADLDLAVAAVFDQLSGRIEETVGGGFIPYVSDSEALPMINLLATLVLDATTGHRNIGV